MRFLPVLALLLLAAAPVPVSAQQETGWIDDEIFVPMRSGQGRQYRVIHRGLRTGTAVNILEWPEDGDWARVSYQDTEGWIEKQYISRAPIAQMKLERLQQRHSELQSKLEQAQSRLQSVRAERDQLSKENRELKASLQQKTERAEHLEEVAAKPIRLDKANQKLNEKVSALRTKLDQAQAQNAMLRDDQTSQQWAMGAGILILGGILGWIFKSRGGRGRSSWMN
jgi:SH3 domain protein